jgi:hypothetical protein
MQNACSQNRLNARCILFDFCDTFFFKARFFFFVVSVQKYSSCAKGLDEGGGFLELILFMTSTGATYLPFSAGASGNTVWGEVRGCELGSFRATPHSVGTQSGLLISSVTFGGVWGHRVWRINASDGDLCIPPWYFVTNSCGWLIPRMPRVQIRRFRKGVVAPRYVFNVYQIIVVGNGQNWDHAPNISGKLRSILRRGRLMNDIHHLVRLCRKSE